MGIVQDMQDAFAETIEDFDEVLTSKSFAATWTGGVASQSWTTTASFEGDWQPVVTSGGVGSGREESGREVRSQAFVMCAVDQEVNEGNRIYRADGSYMYVNYVRKFNSHWQIMLTRTEPK